MICPYCGILFNECGGRGRGRPRKQCGSDPCKRAYHADYMRSKYVPANALQRQPASPGDGPGWRENRFAELDAMIAAEKERKKVLHEQGQQS